MAVFSHITFRFSRGVSSGKKTPIGRKVLYRRSPSQPFVLDVHAQYTHPHVPSIPPIVDEQLPRHVVDRAAAALDEVFQSGWRMLCMVEKLALD